MKDLLRQSSAIKEDLVLALNKQIKMEATSAMVYLAMAAWCDENKYDSSAKFFYKQSNEERVHMLKIFHYLSDMGSKPVVPTVDAVETDFASLKEVFETFLIKEIGVTESIHGIVNLARKNNDINTEEFMRWFVNEQIEEELVARKALDLFELYGDEKLAIAMIDDKISQIGVSSPSSEA